jgi:hypothetical protein
VRIVSRAAAQQELGLVRDPRLLGVALRQVMIRQGTRLCLADSHDVRLGEGFHTLEPANGLRWTDGDAALPPALFDNFDGAMELTLRVGGTTHYVLHQERAV